MAGQDQSALTQARSRTGELERKAFDKSQSASRGSSIGLVILVAVALIAAAGGLVWVGRDYVETYVLTLLAALGTLGICALFAVASGIMRFSGADQANPLLKAVVNGAVDGILVTDHAGRVLYA